MACELDVLWRLCKDGQVIGNYASQQDANDAAFEDVKRRGALLSELSRYSVESFTPGESWF